MIALRFYGSGSQLQVVGDTMGYDKSTVSRVVRDVTDALVDRKDQYIKWPTERQKNINKRAFYEKAGFPNVIGCIDGTHVHIQAPTEDEPAYVNRKGFHSINVQVISKNKTIIYLYMSYFSFSTLLKLKKRTSMRIIFMIQNMCTRPRI
ncbi:unnamed protein product [Mytilus edulis]|nr:unnamed protein product [Mytilus edulis]